MVHFGLLRTIRGTGYCQPPPSPPALFNSPPLFLTSTPSWTCISSLSLFLYFFVSCLDEEESARRPEAVQRVPAQEGGGAGAAGRQHQRENGDRHGLDLLEFIAFAFESWMICDGQIANRLGIKRAISVDLLCDTFIFWLIFWNGIHQSIPSDGRRLVYY